MPQFEHRSIRKLGVFYAPVACAISGAGRNCVFWRQTTYIRGHKEA